MRFLQPAISLVCVFLLLVPPIGAQTGTSVTDRQGFVYENHRALPPASRRPGEAVELEPARSAAARRQVVSILAGHHRAGARKQSRHRAAALWRPDRRCKHPARQGGRVAARRHIRRDPGSLERAHPGRAGHRHQHQRRDPGACGRRQYGHRSSPRPAPRSRTSTRWSPALSVWGTPPIRRPAPSSPAPTRWSPATRWPISATSRVFLPAPMSPSASATRHLTTNGLRTDLNPSTSSSLSLNITQHLLQGFGLAVNSRNIQIAKNNREVSDLVLSSSR